MKQENHPASKLRKYIKKQGIKILLPQNLPDDILKRLVLEVKALDEEKTEEVPSSTLLMCILYLKNGTKITDSMKVEFPVDELFEYFSMYSVYVRLEEMRRKGLIYIPDNSLPTLENIFDKQRSMEIAGLNENMD